MSTWPLSASERPPLERAFPDSNEVLALGVGRHPVGLEPRLLVPLSQDLVRARLTPDHVLAVNTCELRVDAVHPHELLEKLDGILTARVDAREHPLERVCHQIASGRPLWSERAAASDTRSARLACSPVPCAGCRPCSTHDTNSSISGPHGSALSTGTVSGSPSTGKTRRPLAEEDAPMFPSPSTGAAENPYSATAFSHRTRIELENGYERGIDMLPSATPLAPSYSTTATTWPGVGSLA